MGEKKIRKGVKRVLRILAKYICREKGWKDYGLGLGLLFPKPQALSIREQAMIRKKIAIMIRTTFMNATW